jgi:hypothetical protein
MPMKNNYLFAMLVLAALLVVTGSYAQDAVFSNMYVGPGAQVHIKNSSVTFGTNVATDRTATPGIISFDSSPAQGSVSGYVDGYVRIYNTAGTVVFPTGNGTTPSSVSLQDASSANAVTASYSATSAGNTTALDASLEAVSGAEYWTLTGNNSAKPSFSWSSTAYQDFDADNITIAGWNGTAWVALPSVLNTGSTIAAGTITTIDTVDFNQITVFAIGKEREYGDILYVRQDAVGFGTSWDDASGSLQDMIDLATAGKQVWVAKGTYLPLAGTSYSMKEGVEIYGGFAATGAPGMEDRNYGTYPTILQGNGNRVVNNDGNGLTNAAVLDGFILTGGTTDENGAGMKNSGSYPYIANCILRNNNAVNWGGGIFNNGQGSTMLVNCLLYNNAAGGGGASFDNLNTTTQYINCTITNNHSGQNGGGVHTYQNAVATLKNSIVWGNTCGAGGTQVFSAGGGSVNAYFSTISNGGNAITGSYNAVAVQNSDPLFTNSAANSYSLSPASPAINAGSNALYPNAATATDLAGNPRLYNNGTIDMGAYEYQGNADCSLTTTWDGSSWSNGVPASNVYNAVIAGSYTSTGNITACSLTLNSGNVIVTSGHNFIIKGAVNVAGGSLTFEDNANLIQTDNTTNSGNITYKKMSSELHNLDYTIWSSPTSGTQTLKQFSPQTIDERFYVYNTALGLWSNHTSPSGIFGGTPATVTFTKAKGYMVRMPAGLPSNGTSSFEGVFTGVPNNGDIAIAAPAGFNAVGNPYPSPINIHNFIDANAGVLDNDGTLYFWRKTNNAAATTYATINKIAYVRNTAEGGDTGTGYFNAGQEASWVINPGQGFFVKSLGGSIDFKNSMRRALNNGQFFRSANTQSEDSDISRYWLNIKGVGGSFGEMAVAYTAMATTALDYGLDGRLVNDGAASVYSLSGTTKLAIQARPSFIDTDVVPLGFKATTAGSYTISLTDDMDGLFKGNQEIYLRDKITAVVHNLKQGDYSFTTAEGTFNSRFEVIYTDSALGIQEPELADSTLMVYKQEGNIHIEWNNEVIDTVTLFDIRGRVIYQNNEIGSVATVVSHLTAQQQVILVQVTTKDNHTATKKIIY